MYMFFLAVSADPNSDSVRLIEESPTEALKDQFSYRDSALSERFISYIKARAQSTSPHLLLMVFGSVVQSWKQSTLYCMNYATLTLD